MNKNFGKRPIQLRKALGTGIHNQQYRAASAAARAVVDPELKLAAVLALPGWVLCRTYTKDGLLCARLEHPDSGAYFQVAGVSKRVKPKPSAHLDITPEDQRKLCHENLERILMAQRGLATQH